MVNFCCGREWNGPKRAKAIIVQNASVALNAVRPRLSLPSLAMGSSRCWRDSEMP